MKSKLPLNPDPCPTDAAKESAQDAHWSGLFLAVVLNTMVPLLAAANETLYQTSFESPAFRPELPIRDQDNWQMFHDGEAISISTNNAKTGTQCLRFDGALLEQTGPNYARAYCFSRALEGASDQPPIIEIRSSLRLDGPTTGDLGSIGATFLAAVSNSPTSTIFAGGFLVSSDGFLRNYSAIAEDSYKFSVPYTPGTYRTLALRLDFIARRMIWFVDGVELGSGPILSTITADRLYSAYCEMFGQVDPINTPELTYNPTNYTAYFDDYSLVSIPLSPVNAVIEFASTDVLADESKPTASVTVVRRGFTNVAARVTVSTTDDTARAGEDYDALFAFVTFAAGETNKVVEIPLHDDYWAEPDKSFVISISGLPPGATSPKSTARVLIRDDERPGSIDASWFSTLGLPPLGPNDYVDPQIITRQADGKLIVNVSVFDGASFTDLYWRIVRINADGSFDPTFLVFEDRSDYGRARQVVATLGGKILVVEDLDGRQSRLQYRLNPDGTHDTNFTALVIGSIEFVASSPDGKIYVIGGDSLNPLKLNGRSVPRLFRLNNDGTFDSGFRAPTTIFYAHLWPQSNGQVLVTSFETQERWASNLYRLNQDGSRDTSFQVGAARGFHNWINQVITQPDGSLVVCGSFETYSGQVRNSIVGLNPNGSIDPSFQTGSGFIDTQSWSTNTSGQVSLAEFLGGQILVSGYFQIYNGESVTSPILLNLDGTRDRDAEVSEGGTSIYALGGEIHISAFFVRGQFIGISDYVNLGTFFATGSGLGRIRTELPLRIVSTGRDSNGTTRVTANALSGRGYTLQASESLETWRDVNTQPATTNRIEFGDAPGNATGKRFYRVKQN